MYKYNRSREKGTDRGRERRSRSESRPGLWCRLSQFVWWKTLFAVRCLILIKLKCLLIFATEKQQQKQLLVNLLQVERVKDALELRIVCFTLEFTDDI